jgi:hypothetical protein
MSRLRKNSSRGGRDARRVRALSRLEFQIAGATDKKELKRLGLEKATLIRRTQHISDEKKAAYTNGQR